MYSFELKTRILITIFVTTVALVTVSIVRYFWWQPARVEHLFLSAGLLVFAVASAWAWRMSYRGGVRSLVGAVFVFFSYIGLIPDLMQWLSGERALGSMIAYLLKFVGAVGLVLLGSGFLLHRQRRIESSDRARHRLTRLAAEAMGESASVRESTLRPWPPRGGIDAAPLDGGDYAGKLDAIRAVGTSRELPTEFELRKGLSPLKRTSMVALVGLEFPPAGGHPHGEEG